MLILERCMEIRILRKQGASLRAIARETGRMIDGRFVRPESTTVSMESNRAFERVPGRVRVTVQRPAR